MLGGNAEIVKCVLKLKAKVFENLENPGYKPWA